VSLYTEIYDFFNEARPRTKNAGIEDIDRPGTGRLQRDVVVQGDRKKPSKSYSINFNPEGLKSSYKPGSVHEIKFTTLGQTDQKREARTIYRTISEKDFKDLTQNVNPKVLTLVTPSSENNHDKDIYYITIPKVKYGTRTGKDFTYFIYTKSEYLDKLTPEERDKIKIKQVPIKDISDGVTTRNLKAEELKTFLSDKNKEKLKKTKPKDTPKYNDEAETLDIDLSLLIDDDDFEDVPEEKPEDSPEVKASKQQAAEFMLDDKVDRIFVQIIKNYDITKTTSATSTEKQAAKEKLSELLKRFLDSLFDFTNNPQDRKYVVDYNVKNKLQQKPGLYTMIKTSYDNMESLKENYMIKEEISKQEYFLVPTNTEKGKLLKKVFTSNPSFKKANYEGEEGFIKSFDVDQIEKIEKTSGDGLKPIVVYKTNKATAPEVAPEEKEYKIGTVIDGGKENINILSGNKILKLIRLNPQNKDITFKELEANKPYEFTEKLSVGPARKGVITVKSLSPVGERGKRTEFITIDNKEKEKTAKKDKPEMKSVKQMGRWMNVPVNMGVKMADVKPSQLSFKYYVINVDNKEIVNGSDDWAETKKMAQEMGSGYEAVQKAGLPSKGVKINEALSKEDKDKLKNTRVSFTIQSDLDPDKQFNISDNVREVKEEKTKIVLVLAEAGVVTFDKEGTGIFKYSKDNKDYQALNVPADLSSIVKKALAPAKEPESQLEAYIRKRIRQAIKEAEVSQYWGYQGKDVKKKRLEEYLKRYEWGFQDSENPYTHSNGSAIHAIVSKLVHELAAMGVDAIAIFNSYAPKGYQVSDLNQLDYASDSPLGSQLTQPYNPDSLTARGGRVAEEDGKVTSIAQQYLDKVNAKYKKIEDLAKGYNSKDRDIMGSDSVKNVVQKAIASAYGKDAAKAGPELKKAFMSISDEDLKK
jgi:hypothetical protein